MNSLNIMSSKETTIKELKTEVFSEYGTFICHEKYTNHKLTTQYFTTKTVFHKAYQAKDLKFVYYPKADIDKLVELARDYRSPKHKFIKDLKTFSNFNELYCLWNTIDGNLYIITEENPVSIYIQYYLWASKYDLEKVEKHLKSMKDVKNINFKEDIPQNWEISGGQILHFEYKTPSKILAISRVFNRNLEALNHIGLNQFIRPDYTGY